MEKGRGHRRTELFWFTLAGTNSERHAAWDGVAWHGAELWKASGRSGPG